MPRRSEPSPFAAKVGARIRALRVERMMSLGDLGDASELSKGHLSSIEHGLAAITIETLDKIARGLGVPAMYVVAFPDDDLRCRIAEQVRVQPVAELRKVRKELDARYLAAAKTARR
jgi:transcriptional regulator with XRE-family HTH domain